ncbi:MULTISPECIES: FixH family protein [Sulfurimonas]|uniref:FixH family protein n=1 Tax=Sulfurimonas TaxID=202746 RepID=UPI00126573FE|nr:FixH family protein [Sulfurimonas indica]
MSKKQSSGRIWPYVIGISITLVFGFCVATVMVTSKANIQSSDAYMTNYQDADAKANDLIKARMHFDKKYKVSYITESIGGESPEIKYSVVDIEGKPVNNAELIIAISRPETSEFDQKLDNPKVENGIYTFSGAKFPKVGVWNIIAKIKVGDDYRFLNMKADTRIKEAFEFE